MNSPSNSFVVLHFNEIAYSAIAVERSCGLLLTETTVGADLIVLELDVTEITKF